MVEFRRLLTTLAREKEATDKPLGYFEKMYPKRIIDIKKVLRPLVPEIPGKSLSESFIKSWTKARHSYSHDLFMTKRNRARSM